MLRWLGVSVRLVEGSPGALAAWSERTDVGEGPAVRRPRFAALDGFGSLPSPRASGRVSELTFLAEGEEPQCPLWGFDFR